MGDTYVTEPSYHFLLDEDVKHLLPLFPKKRVKTVSKIGLPVNATDDAIVLKAWTRGYTIVTANSRDFNRAVRMFLNTGPKGDCRCLWGLILLPSGQAIQERVL